MDFSINESVVTSAAVGARVCSSQCGEVCRGGGGVCRGRRGGAAVDDFMAVEGKAAI